MLIVDEAHCISDWDMISDLIIEEYKDTQNLLSNVPLLATTAQPMIG